MRNSQRLDNNWLWQYYLENGGKRIEKQEYNWITEHIEMRVSQLKEYYKIKK